MATKTFKEICVEYAHQLGKGLPLTPAEMCNAVIMYLNAQITEMQGITTALQTAVTEAESSATEAINKADDVSETVNAIPKVPAPTTSDNGKVIGVQSGAYALVEQSGGEAPANMVTTDSNQSIIGDKTFTGNVYIRQGRFSVGNILFKPASGGTVSFNPPTTPRKCTIKLPDKDGTVALTDDIPDTTNFVTTNTEQTITATKTFSDIKVGSYELTSDGFEYSGANLVRYSASGREIRYGLSGYNSTVIGSNVKLNLDFNTSYINCTSNNIILGNSNTAIDIRGTRLTYNGADIGSSSSSKLYLHNVTISSAGNGRIYASAITDFDRDFDSFSEIYDHIGKNVSGYYIDGNECYPIVATNIDEREHIYVTIVYNSSEQTFPFDTPEYTDDVKII